MACPIGEASIGHSHRIFHPAKRGDIWPLVTEKCPFDARAALTIHERLEQGDVLGRAAMMIREAPPA
jgi:hypothetical protein